MKVQINNPCHEKLANMTATEKGHFCAVCQKEVIDFTKFTDAEMKAYFSQSKAGSCGTFRKDQLDRTLVQTSPTRPFKVSRWLMSFALLLGACDDQTVVGNIEVKKTTECKNPTERLVAVSGEVATEDNYEVVPVEGVVMHGYLNDAVALAGIRVEVKGRELFCVTDSNGRFSINARIPKNSNSAKITLIFTDQEGRTIEKEIDKNDRAKEKIFYLEFDEEEMEEIRNGKYGIIDLPTKKQSIWQRIRQKFQKGDVA